MFKDPASSEFTTDLVIVGAGLAGMAAGARAAQAGARVLVVEKSSEIGGSAVLSGGLLWTASNYETLREVNPLGDPGLGKALVDGYDDAVEWVRSLDVSVDARDAAGILGYPVRAFVIDIVELIRRCERVITEAGGLVIRNAEVDSLALSDGAVTGAVVRDRDGVVSVNARSTLLTTGGFQASPELRRKFICADGEEILLRSNPHSDGGGLRLGTAAGAATSVDMDGFYGHTVAFPLPNGYPPRSYVRLAQMNSPYGVLLDRDGRRFIDESRGYYFNAQALAKLPGQRALLIGDQTMRDEDRRRFAAAIAEGVDRPTEAAREGAHVAEAETLEELDALVSEWGYRGVRNAIEEFNKSIRSGSESAIEPPRRKNRRPLESPFYAIEVQPAITFTHGGVRIDSEMRAVNQQGEPISGLLAAGADSGGTFNKGYAGGLCLALVFGLRAAQTAIIRMGE